MSDTSPKVGEKVWVFNESRRIYRKDERGNSIGGPIWREHWQEQLVIGETSKSWIIGYEGQNPKKATKIPKGNPVGFVKFSTDEIDRDAWVKDNRYKISDAVNRCGDHDTLKRIAEIIGYKEPAK